MMKERTGFRWSWSVVAALSATLGCGSSAQNNTSTPDAGTGDDAATTGGTAGNGGTAGSGVAGSNGGAGSASAGAMGGDSNDAGSGNSDAVAPMDAVAAVSPFKPTELEKAAAALGNLVATAPLQMGASGDPSKVNLAMLTNSNSPFWGAFQIGVGRVAAKIGCPTSVELLNPPAGTSKADAQATMFQGAIDQAYIGVGISPSTATADDETRFSGLVTSEKVKGNVITFDSDLPGSGRALYIGTDNYKAGVAYGKELLRVLGGTGLAVPFSTVNTPNVRARLQGAMDAVMGSTITFAPLVVVTSPDTPQSSAAKVLTDNPTMAAFASLSTNSGPGCAKAVVAANKVGMIKIVSFDTPSETQQFVKKGVIDVTVGQRAYWEGFLVTYSLYAMSQYGTAATLSALQPWLAGPNQDQFDTGIDVLTKDNLAAYAAYLESIGILTQ
jgi:ribose transport system substrate-binding protein